MTNITEQDSLGDKLRNVRKLWTIFLFISFFLITIIFIASLINLNPKTHDNPNGPIVGESIKPYPFDSMIFFTVLFMLGTVVLVTTTGLARSYHTDKIVAPLFQDSNIIKSGSLTGFFKLKNNVEIEIQWSHKGYFVLANKNEPVAYAKSTELH